MNILMTGATGFLGGYVARALVEQGNKVTAIVREESNVRHLPDSVTYFRCEDFRNRDLLRQMGEVASQGGVYFLHFGWAGVSRDGTSNHQIQESNIITSKEYLKLAQRVGCSRFLFCGSRAEYGNTFEVMEETRPCSPSSEYGIAKHRFHDMAKDYCRSEGMEYLNIRPFSVIGPGDHPWSIIAQSCTKLSKGERMDYGPCSQLWNFMDVTDFSAAVCHLINLGAWSDLQGCPCVNVASFDTRILRSFIEEIRCITNSQSVMFFGSDCSTPFPCIPSIEKLVELTDFKPKNTFNDSIKEIIKSIY